METSTPPHPASNLSTHLREAIGGAASADAWALHITERSMPTVVDSDTGPQEAVQSTAGPAEAPIAAPAPHVDQRT